MRIKKLYNNNNKISFGHMIPHDECNTIITLNEIDSRCEKLYRDKPNQIVIIVLARYSLKEVKNLIECHYEFWHTQTKNDFNFYWLGYSLKETSVQSLDDDQKALLDLLKFDNTAFVNDIEKLKRLTGYHFGDEIGLLLFNCYNGHIRYDKSLYLNIEILVHQESNRKLKMFFAELIDVCQKYNQVEDIKTGLKMKKIFYSLNDITISDILGFAGIGTSLLGSFKLS